MTLPSRVLLGVCVLIKDVGRRLPLELHSSLCQGQLYVEVGTKRNVWRLGASFPLFSLGPLLIVNQLTALLLVFLKRRSWLTRMDERTCRCSCTTSWWTCSRSTSFSTSSAASTSSCSPPSRSPSPTRSLEWPTTLPAQHASLVRKTTASICGTY